MARTTPGQFVKQVRQEMSKVTWPTRRETIISTIMVFIMVVIAAVFLTGVDSLFAWLLRLLRG